MKFIRILKISVGAAGWVWMVLPVIVNGILNAGNGAGMVFFGCLFLWGIFQNKLNLKAQKARWARALRIILITGYAAFTLLFSVESALMLDAMYKTPPADATVVVLGCAVKGETPSKMLSLRIDAAAEFLEENPEANAVLSGGQGNGEDISEALCMYRELVKRGISEDRLYMEDRSTSTRENLAFSYEIIEREGLNKTIAVTSNNFHLYRASLSARALGLEFTSIAASSPYPSLATYVMREYLGIVAQWLVG